MAADSGRADARAAGDARAPAAKPPVDAAAPRPPRPARRPAGGQLVTITTDLYRAEIDTPAA